VSCRVWATGADSRIATDISSNARGRVWGSDEVNVEGWKPLKRLPGHDSGAYDRLYWHLCD
jgi:protein HIRA/HIR1